MKVVINNQYGGFGLSRMAERRYLKLKGKEAFFYQQTEWGVQGSGDVYKRVDDDRQDCFCTFTFTRDYGKTINALPDGDDSGYFYDRDIPRDDPDMIKVVEELGEKANGKCASLKVVEIPDGTEWEIEEYDGNEWVSEKHGTWS